MKQKLSLLVLSCDKYNDLWDNFFKLRDLFWPDSDFDWYLVTESMDYSYKNVNVIHTGKKLNWTGRLKYALDTLDSQFVGLYLDDFYISEKVNNSLIHELVEKMEKESIDHINVSDVFDSLIEMPESHEYYDNHLFKIPRHKKYGISTASAIWKRDFLLSILGNEDKNAWQFEIDLCKLAMSENGLPGTILCDERKPFKVTHIPVVIQGRYYPKAIKEFSKKGLNIDYTARGLMKPKDVLVYNLKTLTTSMLRHHPNLSKNIKWIAKNIFRVKFFTE